MTVILKVSLPIILLVVFMSDSLAGKAGGDAKKKLGLPAGTIGRKQDQDSEKYYPPPLGTRGLSELGHLQAVDEVESQPGQQEKESRVIKSQQGDIKEHN